MVKELIISSDVQDKRSSYAFHRYLDLSLLILGKNEEDKFAPFSTRDLHDLIVAV